MTVNQMQYMRDEEQRRSNLVNEAIQSRRQEVDEINILGQLEGIKALREAQAELARGQASLVESQELVNLMKANQLGGYANAGRVGQAILSDYLNGTDWQKQAALGLVQAQNDLGDVAKLTTIVPDWITTNLRSWDDAAGALFDTVNPLGALTGILTGLETEELAAIAGGVIQ